MKPQHFGMQSSSTTITSKSGKKLSNRYQQSPRSRWHPSSTIFLVLVV